MVVGSAPHSHSVTQAPSFCDPTFLLVLALLCILFTAGKNQEDIEKVHTSTTQNHIILEVTCITPIHILLGKTSHMALSFLCTSPDTYKGEKKSTVWTALAAFMARLLQFPPQDQFINRITESKVINTLIKKQRILQPQYIKSVLLNLAVLEMPFKLVYFLSSVTSIEWKQGLIALFTTVPPEQLPAHPENLINIWVNWINELFTSGNYLSCVILEPLEEERNYIFLSLATFRFGKYCNRKVKYLNELP